MKKYNCIRILKLKKNIISFLLIIFYQAFIFSYDIAIIKLPSGRLIEAEIAKDPISRAKGLMFRSSLKENQGMLFIFENQDFHSFWMKNTLIPLDIIWISQEKKIVYYVENAAPCKNDPCPSYKPIQKAKYVLEVNAGLIKKEKIKIGDTLSF